MQTTPLWTAALVAALGLAGCGGGDPSASESSSESRESSQQVARANQGICDGLKAPGVSSGLHGLCVAYCEALNCPDATAGAAALSAQCRAACPTVLANYDKSRKPSDPAMPCVKPPPACPCWTAGELTAVGRSYSPHRVDWFRNAFSGYESSALVENRDATDQFPYGGFALAQIDETATADNCRYFYADFAPNAPAPTIRVQA